MRVRCLTLLICCCVSEMTFAQPPQLVQMVRETILPGNESAYKALEDEMARACVDLGCPHPYLALAPVADANDIWWLNFFASEAERREVVSGYEAKQRLIAALQKNTADKAKLTGEVAGQLLVYRRDLSANLSFNLATLRYLVVAVTPEAPGRPGAVYAAPDGSYFILELAATKDEAVRKAGKLSDAMVLAVLPNWSLPSTTWIDADPDFWERSPLALQRAATSSDDD